VTAFERHIRAVIAHEGPITVERYMSLCIGHYYATRDPFGVRGDFTTAPEISQMFGELIGLWSVAVWQAMGSPATLALVELGPGRGTLMADALRAARLAPAYLKALSVHLVETSPTLRAHQERTLASSGIPVAWHASLESVPAEPAIVVANEFFDALPVRQFVATERGWCERVVALDGERLAFGALGTPEPSLGRPKRAGDILEIPEAGEAMARALARRLARDGGAALLIDYGHWEPNSGDTLQAVKGHGFADPLSEPGEADLTAHVAFRRLAGAASQEGVIVHGPASQGDFLRALGIEARAAGLKARATPAQAAAIDAALERLTERGRTGMGELFKVLGLGHPSIPGLPGLEPASDLSARS
jgi:NADH dehydrogenase [ubiquinone] 1 alpha subcomplex assembly factor 7